MVLCIAGLAVVVAGSAGPWSVHSLTVGALLAVAGFVDMMTRRIPNLLLVVGALVWLLLAFSGDVSQLGSRVASGGTVLLLMLIFRASGRLMFGKPGFGMGDVKLVGILGLYLGYEIFWALYFAIALAAIYAMFGFLSGRMTRASKLPFAPFLAAGTLCSALIDLAALLANLS